jgi:CDP-diacylglycerol--glycerol-3-phosphate 3-phosphatidyltransferase/cardiolipin synthase
MNIPNQLTLLRIILIPVFVLVFYLPFEWNNLVACVIFVLAAVTDILDGYLARKLNQTSSLGAFLDPVADKLMVAAALVLLVQQNPNLYLALAAAVIIGREITVSALREWMAEIGARKKVAVSALGKIKTIAQMVALGFLIFEKSVLGLPVYQIGLVLLYIAAFLTIISMFQYILAAWPELKE